MILVISRFRRKEKARNSTPERPRRFRYQLGVLRHHDGKAIYRVRDSRYAYARRRAIEEHGINVRRSFRVVYALTVADSGCLALIRLVTHCYDLVVRFEVSWPGSPGLTTS